MPHQAKPSQAKPFPYSFQTLELFPGLDLGPPAPEPRPQLRQAELRHEPGSVERAAALHREGQAIDKAGRARAGGTSDEGASADAQSSAPAPTLKAVMCRHGGPEKVRYLPDLDAVVQWAGSLPDCAVEVYAFCDFVNCLIAVLYVDSGVVVVSKV